MKVIIRDSEIFVYVLLLENNKYYIGQSVDVEKRYLEHLQSKKGANFTKINKPICVLKIFQTGTKNNIEALSFENYITLLYMRFFGIENVRGGKYFRIRCSTDINTWLLNRIKIEKYKIRLYKNSH